MFNIVVNDGSQELPSDDIYYIIAKEGIFLKKRIGVMESIAPVKNISILNSVDTMARMHIKQIPATTGAKILEFFKAVYDKFQSEAIVLLFYNEKSKTYKIVAPQQQVTAASAKYNRGVTIKDYTMIGTIHSHGSMSAFHSGVDDSDETTFDGLHITFGNVNQDEISISSSIVSNGSRFIVKPQEYLAGLVEPSETTTPEPIYTRKVYKYENGKLVMDEQASHKYIPQQQKFSGNRYIFKVAKSKRIFDQNWLNMVERGTYSYNYQSNIWSTGLEGVMHHPWYSDHFRNFKRRNFTGFHQHPYIQRQLPHIPGNPLNVGESAKVKPVEFPSHEIDLSDDHPCLTCKYKNIKILHEEEDIDYYDDVKFKCTKCGTIIDNIDETEICLICNTGDHLTMIDETEFSDKYVADDTQPSQQPKQQLGFIECENCKNTFLRLENTSVCPYCYTSVGESDDDKIECPFCYAKNDRSWVETEKICTSCKSSIKVNTEDDLIERQRTDSGSYLDITDDEHDSVLQAAQEEDKNLERIPDPSRDHLPLTTSMKIIQAMRKVFGGGK